MLQLGDILSELREDRGLTQRELSKILHTSNSSISAYEIGQRIPSIDILIKLAEFFDVTTDYLLGISPSPLSPSVLSDELIRGTTIASVIEMLKAFTPEQSAAIMLIIEQMKFYTDVAGRTRQRKGKPE
jgi:transcriptional regulator with XRE-family HTH domain